MKENLYEPIKQYKQIYKSKHEENVSNYFEELVKKSQVDEHANKETIKELEKVRSFYEQSNKKKARYKGFKIFLIVLVVISFIVAGIFGINLGYGVPYINMWADILIIIAFAALAIGLIVLSRKKITPIIKAIDGDLSKLADEITRLEKLSWEQMAPLNRLFDWGIGQELVTKTVPLLELDTYFDSKRYDILNTKYNLWGNENVDSSILHCQSGQIMGNPFVIGRNLNTYMGTKTYTGTRVITYTVTTTDSKGNRRTSVRTQTLVATVTKPAPIYYTSTFLAYGNEAAPDLVFSRKAQHSHKLSEKQISGKVKKGSKKISKKSEKSIAKGSNFTAMTDERFDVLFNALDRNHEVQFRLLFTPLAQREMMKILLDDKVGFGDDFSFHKQNLINIVMPEHLHQSNLELSPELFIGNDLEAMRKKFNNLNNDYFKTIYFTFAPVLAIPLYQQHKPHEYIYKDTYETRVSPWEHESMVNRFNSRLFAHPLAATTNILKTKFIKGLKNADEVEITARSYSETPQVDVVMKLGGDGRMHSVPVKWYQYDPVVQKSTIVVQPVENLNRPNLLVPSLTGKSFIKELEERTGPNTDFVYKKNLMAYTTDTKLDPLYVDKASELLYNKD